MEVDDDLDWLSETERTEAEIERAAAIREETAAIDVMRRERTARDEAALARAWPVDVTVWMAPGYAWIVARGD